MTLSIWGEQYSREAIAEVPVPQATSTYQPIPHGEFVDMVEDSLKDYGFYFGDQAHVMSNSGKRYFGMAEIYNNRSNEDYRLLCGWRSSYDKSCSASLIVGSSVFVCSNMAFSGEIQVGRKHTSLIYRFLPDLLREAAKKVAPMRDLQDERYARYKEHGATNTVTNRMIVKAIRNDIIPASKSALMIQECYEPRHEEHLNNGARTAWTVFNAATETLKNSSIHALPERTQKLHKILDQEVGFHGRLAA